jgi:hypothetical protein
MILITNSRARNSTSNGQGETDDHTNNLRPSLNCSGSLLIAYSIWLLSSISMLTMFSDLLCMVTQFDLNAFRFCSVHVITRSTARAIHLVHSAMILITNSRARNSTSNGQGETDDHTNKSRQADVLGQPPLCL